MNLGRVAPFVLGGAVSAAVALYLWGPPSTVRSAKAAVARDMRDPGSVQFRDVTRGFEGRVCGEVNAKNAMGAYVGFRRFVWSEREGVYLGSDDERGNDHFWVDLCTPAGDDRARLVRAAEVDDSAYVAGLSPTARQAHFGREIERMARDLGVRKP